MRYLYLDHNIYISALYDEELKEYLKKLINKNIQCIYSPAHIEEAHKVKINAKSPHCNKMDELMEFIGEITNNKEALPTANEIEISTEQPQKCYKRVSRFDTTKYVENNSLTRFFVDSANYNSLLANDPHAQSISALDEKSVWEYPQIKESIDNINKNISNIIFKYNNSYDIIIFNKYGIDKTLPWEFTLHKNQFSTYKMHHTQLEYAIEILFRILNYNGYNAEKKYVTSISGTHDVSHAIYATKADWLITLDKRFYKKCKAVYYYIGANTQVINCKNDQIISEIENIIK